MKLAKSCDEKLKKAEEAITKLVKDNGDVVDFKVEEQNKTYVKLHRSFLSFN